MKRCRICNDLKPFDAFCRMKEMRDGYRNDCKECNLAERAAKYRSDPEMQQRARSRAKQWRIDNREQFQATRRAYVASGRYAASSRKSHLKRTFGITPEEYEARLAEQGGGCAVCGRPPKAGKSLHVDHDHDTGYVRGLLCFSCNAALGHFQDDVERIDAALIYVATKRRVSALRLAP
jgi:Recombination endonuclease VII